ncbi:hypothetical protein [Spirosoma sp.]|uniref:hypothetical protein n=1 Tax=Spirosoma sp. TaxID=1899569 RepID=UPI0026262F0E|nr:hypothetical protein [Spirosoma sp.]MCX6216536.1 hypothetical protein [Spirosoma sp.]
MSTIDPATILICQKSSLTRLHQRVQAVNEAVPPRRFKKLINGQEVEYERKPKAITGSVEATAERLIKDYVKQYHGLLKQVGSAAVGDDMPPLQTCRLTLANRRTISEKTAYNHLRRLREAGFITRYKFRGSRHAFEIWIDPALLFQAERAYPQPAVKNAQPLVNHLSQTVTFSTPTANFTAYKASVTQGYSETEKKADGNVHSDAPKVEHGDEHHGNTERLQPTRVSEGPNGSLGTVGHSDKGAGGPGAADSCGQVDNPDSPRSAGQRAKARLTKSDLDARRAASRTEAQRQAILEGYLISFWNYAKQLLYSSKVFADYEEPLILNAIRSGVYRNFGPALTEKEWDAYQTELYKRIELAASYYQRHPDKWVPDPYALHRPGTGYFDEANTRGFGGTLAWVEENNRNYRKSYEQQQINLAVRHLQLHRVDKAPRTLQQKTYVEAFRHLQHKIGRFGPQAVERFLTLVSTLGSKKPQLTPGFTRNFKK